MSSAASAAHPDVVLENISVTLDGYTYKHSWIAYLRNQPPAPVILVHPNYAGLKQFDIDQAVFLARRGYVGFAVDTYEETERYSFEDRNITTEDGPEKIKAHYAGAISAWNNLLLKPRKWRALLRKYLDTAFEHPAVASGQAGAIGYCAGGQAVLEHVRNGDPIQAGVTFHGLLNSRPLHLDRIENGFPTLYTEEEFQAMDLAPNNYNTKVKLLIEHGQADHFVPPEHITEFAKEMNDQKIDWRLTMHGNTDHGFALPDVLIGETYDETADRRSTLGMLSLFQEVWPKHRVLPVHKNACGTVLRQIISADDEGAADAVAGDQAPASGKL